MRIVVTGSEGFIGGHLVEALLIAGHEVVGLDRKTGHDITNCDLPNADLAFHLAAQTDATSAGAYTGAETNVMGLLRVLMRYHGAGGVGSSAMVEHPVTPYAITKLAGEKYCAIYGASVVRLCNIFGPGGHSVIDRFASDETLTVFGSGCQTREYAHVAQAVSLFMRELGERQPLRVLRGERLSVLDVLARFPGKPHRFAPARAFDPVLV